MDAPRESLNGDDMEPKINKFFSGQALEQSYEHFLTLLLLVDSNGTVMANLNFAET